MKTIEERKAIIAAIIVKHQKSGWIVTNQTDTNCQLRQPKKPDTCLVVFLFLLCIIPGLLYLIFAKGDMTVFIEVNEEGKVKYTSKDLTRSQLSWAETEANNLIIIQKPAPDVTTNNLGLLTTKTIADGLKIAEEDVIKLIESNQLKGKKLGDKYFVVKEDFDAFMKK
jgi:excisionase family DNA binding protein